jgi:hypothetical protein
MKASSVSLFQLALSAASNLCSTNHCALIYEINRVISRINGWVLKNPNQALKSHR